MKKPKLDDYELFYMEIPQTDYLNDIDIHNEEDTEPATFNKKPNMSNEQVSALARDQLGLLEHEQNETIDDQDSLFSNPSTNQDI